jgi:hypothetical protein
MNESDIEDQPNLNTGKKWDETDLLDLANCVRLNDLIEEIANFMCRSRREIREKIAELERSDELHSIERRVSSIGEVGNCGDSAFRGSKSTSLRHQYFRRRRPQGSALLWQASRALAAH